MDTIDGTSKDAPTRHGFIHYDDGKDKMYDETALGARACTAPVVQMKAPKEWYEECEAEEEDEDEDESEFNTREQIEGMKVFYRNETCESLGLATQGTEQEVISRLLAHYETQKKAVENIPSKLDQQNLTFADLEPILKDAMAVKGVKWLKVFKKGIRKLKELKAEEQLRISQGPPGLASVLSPVVEESPVSLVVPTVDHVIPDPTPKLQADAPVSRPRPVQESCGSSRDQDKKKDFTFDTPEAEKKYKTLVAFGNKDKSVAEEVKVILEDLAERGHIYGMDKDGTRIMQKGIEVATNDLKERIANTLKDRVVQFIKNKHGNYVVQKVIEDCAHTVSTFILEEIQPQTKDLAEHVFGCRVFCRLFEHHDLAAGIPLQMINDHFLKNIDEVIKHRYASYPMRSLVERGTPAQRARIARTFHGRFLEYAKHEFASFIVELVVEKTEKSERATLDPLVAEVKGNSQEDEQKNLTELYAHQRGRHIYNKLKSLQLISSDIHIPRNQARQKRAQEEHKQAAVQEIGSLPPANYGYQSNMYPPSFMGMPNHVEPIFDQYGRQLDPNTMLYMMSLFQNSYPPPNWSPGMMPPMPPQHPMAMPFQPPPSTGKGRGRRQNS